MPSLGDLMVRVGANISEFESAMSTVGQNLGQLQAKVERTFDGLDAVGQKLSTLGMAMTASLTLPIVALASASIKAAGDMEQARIGFTTMLGSAAAANSMLRELQTFAQSTPFEFPQLVDATRRLLAMGFAAKDLIPTLRIVGDTVAGLGGGAQMIDRVTLALGQMNAKGKVSAQEMNQLAENGIPAWDILAKKIGVTIPEAMKLAEKGMIAAADAVPALLAGMNDKFAGLMEKQSHTLLGMWSNMKDRISATLISIGDALAPTGKAILTALDPVLKFAQSAADAFAKLPEPVRVFAISLGALAAAAGPVTLGVGLLVRSFVLLETAVPAVVGGLVAMSTGFAGFATSALPAAAAALIEFGTVALPAAIAGIGAFSTSLLTGAAAAVFDFAVTAIPAAISGVIALGSGLASATTAMVTFATTGIVPALKGLVMLVTEGITAAIAGMGNLAASAIPMLTGALSALGVAASLAAAAFGGWKLGEWLYENSAAMKSFGDGAADLIMKIPGVTMAIENLSGASNAAAHAAKDLEPAIANLQTRLAAHGVVIKQGAMSTEEYAAALRKAAFGLTDSGNAAAKAALLVKQHAEEMKKNAEALKEAQKVYTEVKKLFAEGAASASDVAAALKKVQEAAAKAHPELTATGVAHGKAEKAAKSHAVALSKFSVEVLYTIADMVKLRDEISKLSEAELFGNSKWFDEAIDGSDKLSTSLKSLAGSFGTTNLLADQFAGSGLKIALHEAAPEAERLALAFKAIAAADLQKAADVAAQNLEILKSTRDVSGQLVATEQEITIAKKQSLEATIALGKARLDDTTAAQAQLEQLNQATGTAKKKQSEDWKQLSREINTALESMSKAIGDFLFKGDFSMKGLMDMVDKIGQAFTRLFTEIALKGINSLIKDGLMKLGQQLGILDGQLNNTGGILARVFGGSTSTGTATGAASSATGSAGSTASSGSAAAGSGLTSILGVANLAVSAISGIVQGIQGAHMNSLLDKIEKSTRRTDITLEGVDGVNEHVKATHWAVAGLWTDLGSAGWFHDAFASLMSTTEGIFELLKKGITLGAGGPSTGGSGGSGETPTSPETASAPVVLDPRLDQSVQDFEDFTGQAVTALNQFGGAIGTIEQPLQDLANATAAIGVGATAAAAGTKSLADQIGDLLSHLSDLEKVHQTASADYDATKTSLIELSRQQAELNKILAAQGKETVDLSGSEAKLMGVSQYSIPVINGYTQAIADQAAAMTEAWTGMVDGDAQWAQLGLNGGSFPYLGATGPSMKDMAGGLYPADYNPSGAPADGSRDKQGLTLVFQGNTISSQKAADEFMKTVVDSQYSIPVINGYTQAIADQAAAMTEAWTGMVDGDAQWAQLGLNGGSFPYLGATGPSVNGFEGGLFMPSMKDMAGGLYPADYNPSGAPAYWDGSRDKQGLTLVFQGNTISSQKAADEFMKTVVDKLRREVGLKN